MLAVRQGPMIGLGIARDSEANIAAIHSMASIRQGTVTACASYCTTKYSIIQHVGLYIISIYTILKYMVFYSKKMEIPRITPIEFYPVVMEGLIVWQNSNPENPTGTCCMWKWKCSGGIMCPLYPQTDYSGNVINLFQSCIRPKRISFNIGSLHGHMLNELNHRLSTPETVAWGPARPPGHWGPNDDSRPWI